MQKTPGPALKREIGATALALNAMNLTIGAGIFVLPGTVAASLGSAAFIAYLLCGLLVILIMLCYAEVGSKVTTTGGSYAYVEKAFGPFAGFLINSLCWFGFSSLADAAVINAMADMLTTWFPAFSIAYIRVIFFIAVFALLSIVNIRGVKHGSQFAVATTIIKLTPLVLLALIGIFNIEPQNLLVKNWPTVPALGEAALVLFFAFMGIETALNISGEIKQPQKSIPRGIFMGVFGVLVLYLLLQLVAQGVLGERLSLSKEAPLSALAMVLVGAVGGTIMLISSLVSIFGLLSSDVLASPRLLFEASTDKLLPAFLGKVHPRFATPHWSIIVYSLSGVILASSGGFKQLAVYASSSLLIIYLAVVLAMIKLRLKNNARSPGGFTVPGGLIIPVLAIITICWFLSNITHTEVIAMAIFFAGLSVLYGFNKWVRREAKG